MPSSQVLVAHEPQGVIAVCSPSSTAIEDTTGLSESMQSDLGVPWLQITTKTNCLDTLEDERVREYENPLLFLLLLFVCWINLVGFTYLFIYFISNNFLFSFSYLAVRPIRITPTIRREYYLSIKLFIHMFVCLFVNENY